MQNGTSELTPDELKFLSAAMDRRFDKWADFKPYPKQLQFFALSATCKESMLFAGNQQGKTEAGAFATSCHLTGDYPPWWPGKRWDRPVRGWASGETSDLVRDASQKKLCGTPGVDEDFGTGFIPRDRIIDKSLARGVTDAYDTIQVRHKSGGVSTLKFKSYEQGRKKFQSDTVDFVWSDEECPEDIWGEIIARVTATQGIIFSTYTPVQGNTSLTDRFLKTPNADRRSVTMTIWEADHIPQSEKQKTIDSYPEHEREARAMGVPMRGEGRVYPYTDSSIWEDPIREVPAWWAKAWLLDFGLSKNTTSHAFGALLALHDRDNDVLHIHHEIKLFAQPPLVHVHAINSVAEGLRCLWPHDGHKTGPGDGHETVAIANIYKKLGLRMADNHTTFEAGGYSVEAGILDITSRIDDGRFKVSKLCTNFFEEFRSYYRKDGKVVPENDDLLSCARQGVMGLRYFQQLPLGSGRKRQSQPQFARDLDYDLFDV